jgi:hypothetical protein
MITKMNEILFYIFIIVMSIYYYHLNNYTQENYNRVNHNEMVYADMNRFIFHYLLIQNIQNMNQNQNNN